MALNPPLPILRKGADQAVIVDFAFRPVSGEGAASVAAVPDGPMRMMLMVVAQEMSTATPASVKVRVILVPVSPTWISSAAMLSLHG